MIKLQSKRFLSKDHLHKKEDFNMFTDNLLDKQTVFYDQDDLHSVYHINDLHYEKEIDWDERIENYLEEELLNPKHKLDHVDHKLIKKLELLDALKMRPHNWNNLVAKLNE